MLPQLASLNVPYTANPATPARAYTTVAQIDLNRLRKNAQLVRTLAAPAEVMAVVKANAYGHGVLPIVQTLIHEGFNHFMVASLSEALYLRTSGVQAPILIAMPPIEANLSIYSQEHFWVSVSSDEVCHAVLSYAKSGHPLQVHIKLDTGMNRLGLTPSAAHYFFEEAKKFPAIEIQGIWTHLATAGHSDTSFAKQQISIAQSFTECLELFEGIFHVGNSSSLIHPERYLPPRERNMYRVGGALLGISAMPERAREVGLHPIMTLKSHVLSVKSLAVGQSVSYGRRWTASKDTHIAVVGAGYADGYPSSVQNLAAQPSLHVSIKDQLYPVVGSICMDMFMVDVGSHTGMSHVKPGDEVTLFGDNGPDINEVARASGRKAYEISCSVSQRVVRTYL